MNRNALKLIVAIVMLSLSSASVLAQTPATTSQKFNIRNALGQTITLTGATSGVTPYTLTLPPAAPGLLGQVLSSDLSGNLSWATVGLGSVTSVGLTMPSIFSVAGSPVTTSGTLAVSLASQSANTVFAAPSGGAGTPSFRLLTASDIPALPYVSSVGLALPASVFSVSGSPVTGSGTLTGSFTSQAANTVFAAPDGGAGTPTFRALSATDIPALSYVSSVALGNLSPLFTTSNAGTALAPSFTFSQVSQNQNLFFASPDGSSGNPTFRSILAADLPDLGGSYIKNQTSLQSSSNFHISGNGQIEGQLQLKGTSTGITTFQAGAQGATDINYTLPVTAPASNNQVLAATTAGVMSWITPSTAGAWSLTGNASTTPGTNFLGTTDAVDLVVKTSNSERLRVDASGQVGFGRSTPDAKIDLDGGMIWRPDTLDLTSGVTVSGGANIRHDNISIGDRTYYYVYDTATFYGNRVTGFADGYNGKLLRIFNSTHTTMTLVVDDANSSAANRIRNPIGDNSSVGIVDSGFADLVYDGETQKWLIVSVTGPTSTATSGYVYFARKTSDQTLTDGTHGTTMQSSGMTISIFPDIVHSLDGMLYFSCPNSNTDVKISFDLPNNFVLARITALGHSDGGTNVVEGSDILDTDNGASETYNVSAGKILFIQISGMFINGPSNGTLTVNFARANGGGGTQDLTLLTGSYIRLIPVAVN